MESGENNSKNKKLQDLVLFEDISTIVKDREKISKRSEDIDQENKIKLFTELTPHMGKYRYSCKLNNESNYPIKEVKIKIQYPSFLELKRTIPPTIVHTPTQEKEEEEDNIELIKIEFDEMKKGEDKEVVLYFRPSDNQKEADIKSFAAFINKDDYVRVINSEILTISLNEIIIQPKIIPSAQVAEFIKNPNIRKAIKSIGIGKEKELDYVFLFNRLEIVLRAKGFQFIAKDKDKHIVWYFGTDLESNQDILVVGQEKNKKLEWIVTCKDPELIISVILTLMHELKENLLRMGIIDDENQIYDLECKACGYALPRFPEKGKLVTCSKCGVEQIVW